MENISCGEIDPCRPETGCRQSAFRCRRLMSESRVPPLADDGTDQLTLESCLDLRVQVKLQVASVVHHVGKNPIGRRLHSFGQLAKAQADWSREAAARPMPLCGLS